MAKINVASTYQDLQKHRAQVERAIRRMGHEDVAMEYYVAEDQRPVAKCLADVAACDAYVGIFAWRYGWQPNTASVRHNPDYFATPDELARKVAQAIYKLLPAAVPIREHNLTAYHTALRKRYGVLALEGLTPPQKEE